MDRAIVHHRRGFTLLELLVVIAIIAVLAGLLMPAAASARRAGQRVTCLSNVRQLGLAMIAYANDNGRFPRPGQQFVPNDADWIYCQPGRDLKQSVILRYISDDLDGAVYRCPVDDVSTHQRYAPSMSAAIKYPFSYSVNAQICKQVSEGPTRRPNQIRRPAQVILVIDESSETVDDGCWAHQGTYGSGANVLSARHDRNVESSTDFEVGVGVVCFADAHAAVVRRGESFSPAFYDPGR